MNKIEELNRALFLQLNGTENSPVWLLAIVTSLADFLIFSVSVLLLVMWLWGSTDRRNTALKASLVAMIGVGANQVIGLIWPHPRPFMIGLGHAFIPHVADSSFPSDHATVLFGVAFTLLAARNLFLGTGILACGLLVAWARVFLGIHFPLDMVGGAGVAAITLGILTPVWNRAGVPVTASMERLYRRLFRKPIALGIFYR